MGYIPDNVTIAYNRIGLHMDELPLYYTVEEAATRLHVKPRTVRDWCHGGKLKASKVAGGRWLIPVSVVAQLIEDRRITREPDASDD